jgi:hypothetical protein
MSHTIRQKKKLIARVSRLKGQLGAVERALEAERPCGDILQLLASIRGALNGLTGRREGPRRGGRGNFASAADLHPLKKIEGARDEHTNAGT